jgi:5-formyltetrahydrofolate cyclo-ligase
MPQAPSPRAALRDQARAWRRGLDATVRAQADAAIATRLAQLVRRIAPTPSAIGLFAPFGDETTACRQWFDAAPHAHRFALPRCDRTDRTMTFHEAPAWPTTAGAYGIDEPPEHSPVVPSAALRVVVVPGLAFDPRGHRLGYGAGFYDRALGALGVQAVLVGVCYGGQCVDEIPTAPHDVPVDFVVTESFLIDARARREAPAK